MHLGQAPASLLSVRDEQVQNLHCSRVFALGAEYAGSGALPDLMQLVRDSGFFGRRGRPDLIEVDQQLIGSPQITLQQVKPDALRLHGMSQSFDALLTRDLGPSSRMAWASPYRSFNTSSRQL